MTREVFTPAKPDLAARLYDMLSGLRDTGRDALREAMTWSAYQWTVLAVLTATFILVALSYGGIRAELAALKSERGGPDPASVSAEISKQMSNMQAVLIQAISEMKSGLSGDLAKIGAKLDVRSQAPKPAGRAAKPGPKPRPQ